MVRTLLTWIFAGASLCQAQTILPNPDSVVHNGQSHSWVIKFAPLSLFDPDNTIQFGVERRLGNRHGIQAEFGYGWQGMNLWRNSQSARYSHREVWRTRAEYRYYFNPSGAPLGRYIAVEGLFKRVNALESGTVGVGCETGLCQYYRFFTEPISKFVWGAHVKVGRQFAFTTDGRLLMDFYGGLGFRQSQVERADRPMGVYYYESAGYNLFNTFSSRQYPILSVAYGFKLSYSL